MEQIVADDSTIRELVQNWEDIQQPIGEWDVSRVTNMANLFEGVEDFNEDISRWNVSNVTNMSYMFASAEQFSRPIGSWDVSKVTDMSYMFNACDFNKPIENWNISNVTNFSGMFFGASWFKQPLNKWGSKLRNATDMSLMFALAEEFDQPLDKWDVSNVKIMSEMFVQSGFNQDISRWNVSNVVDMRFMFCDSPFGYNLRTWGSRLNPRVNVNSMFKDTNTRYPPKWYTDRMTREYLDTLSTLGTIMLYNDAPRVDAIVHDPPVPLRHQSNNRTSPTSIIQPDIAQSPPFDIHRMNQYPNIINTNDVNRSRQIDAFIDLIPPTNADVVDQHSMPTQDGTIWDPIEYENANIRDVLQSPERETIVVFLNGHPSLVYISLLRETIYNPNAVKFVCLREIPGVQSFGVTFNDVYYQYPFIGLQNIGCSIQGMISISDAKYILQHNEVRAINLVVDGRAVATASFNSVNRDPQRNIVSADHCQSGSDKTIYHIETVRFIIPPKISTKGGRSKRKKNHNKKRSKTCRTR